MASMAMAGVKGVKVLAAGLAAAVAVGATGCCPGFYSQDVGDVAVVRGMGGGKLYETETIENLQVYNVNDGDLVACFANDIPEAAIRQIAAAKPLRAVFRDSSFKSDSAKINVTEIFKTISPNTTVKVV